LVLPLFPAEPKLGPVYQEITQFIPPQFPLLLIIPAFLLDLLWERTRNWNAWRIAAMSGTLYAIVLVAAEWPFGTFLMSPAARNRFFGTMYLFYGLPPVSFLARNEFVPNGGVASLLLGFLIACIAAALAVGWGISRGNWMRSIQR
jgi:hypothetical protein